MLLSGMKLINLPAWPGKFPVACSCICFVRVKRCRQLYRSFPSLLPPFPTETFPETVSTEVIGQSYEGRDMRVIKICGGGECGKKPGMYIEGGEEF